MCGRFLLTSPVDALAALFEFQNRPNLAPRWNIAPTQTTAVVRPTGAGRELAMLRWGLVPAWAKDPASGPPLINARGETVAEKPSFRDAFKMGRCLVPANGFYEWSGKGKEKQAWFADPGGPIAFAGIASLHKDKDGEPLESFAIVTTAATGPIAEVHHRAPVAIAAEDAARWMEAPPEDALALIQPPPEDLFELVKVDNRVGNVREDDAQLIEPKVDAPPPACDQMSLF